MMEYEFPPYQSFKTTPPSPSPPRTKATPLQSSLSTFTAEMISWIWFSDIDIRGSVKGKEVTRNQLAMVPSEKFMMFCRDILVTTQVSKSVVILALYFVASLKKRNSIKGAPGSEFRLVVISLMIANKILDDNTYTARTWSEVSSLDLFALVAAEIEFLKGIDFQLNVTKKEYDTWTNVLEGHVAARQSILRLAARKDFDKSRLSELEPRRHSVGYQPIALSKFSFPPRHSSLSHTISYNPSTLSHNNFNHTRTRSYPSPIFSNDNPHPRLEIRQNSLPTSKRSASNAFSEADTIHQSPVAKRLITNWSTYGVGSSPIPTPLSSSSSIIYPSPGSFPPLSGTRNGSCSDGTFRYLVDAFSPNNAPRVTHRHDNLSFYSLASGPSYYPPTTQYDSLSPDHLQNYDVSAPLYKIRQEPYQSNIYSPAGSLSSQSPNDFYSSTPPSEYGTMSFSSNLNQTSTHYSYFSNAGIPAVCWTRPLRSQ